MNSCLNHSNPGDLTFNRNAFIVRSLEGMFLVLTSIMYACMMCKIRGKKILNSRFCCYKRNILTLKETFVLEIVNELFALVFVILVDHLNYFVSYCIVYSTYCMILYFLIPILLLFSLRNTLPEFYVNPLNSMKTTKAEFYAICKPINLEPRNPELTTTIENYNAESKITENSQKDLKNITISSVSEKCCPLPQIE